MIDVNVAVFDVDSKIPNLALMKVSAYHKAQGDTVEHFSPLMSSDYDRVYASKVFSFPHENDRYIQYKNPKWIIGGTGVDHGINLPKEIENSAPDYSLYGVDYSIGFASRGCRLSCGFCVVPTKEGKCHSTNSIKDLITNSTNKLILLDNDFFGNPEWESVCNEIIEIGCRVSICQGVNLRNITKSQAEYLGKVKPYSIHFDRRCVYTAWDDIKDEKAFFRGLERVQANGIKNILCYVLIGYNSSPEEDMHRVKKLSAHGVDPFVMPFDKNDRYQKDFTRWVNHKATFKTIPFEDFGGKRRSKQQLDELSTGGLFA